MTIHTDRVIYDLLQERARQDKKWGEQNHPNGTGGHLAFKLAEWAKSECDEANDEDRQTWKLILQEEVYEAFAESDPDKLRAELVQVIAVATAWVEYLDRQSLTTESEVVISHGA